MSDNDVALFGAFMQGILAQNQVSPETNAAIVQPLLAPSPGDLVATDDQRVLDSLLTLRSLTLDAQAAVNATLDYLVGQQNMGSVTIEPDPSGSPVMFGSLTLKSMPNFETLQKSWAGVQTLIDELKSLTLPTPTPQLGVPLPDLQNAVTAYFAGGPVPSYNNGAASKAYETWVFTSVLGALVPRAGWMVQFFGALTGQLQPGAQFVVRGNPGLIGSLAQDFGYALVQEPNNAMEVHIDVKIGSANVVGLIPLPISFGMDVAIITRAAGLAARNPANPVPLPRYNTALGLCECKLYGTSSSALFDVAAQFVGRLAGMCGNPMIFIRPFTAFCSNEEYPRVSAYLPTLPNQVRASTFENFVPNLPPGPNLPPPPPAPPQIAFTNRVQAAFP